MNKKSKGWKEYCPSCKKNHIMIQGVCSSCRINSLPEIKSVKVSNKCKRIECCDGCEAYKDHLR